jgi:hypothetical protein
MTVAFSEPSDASNSVLQSVLALASLQLNGGSNSFRYKQNVVLSSKEPADWPDEIALLRHLTALMLLYHHEVSLLSLSAEKHS